MRLASVASLDVRVKALAGEVTTLKAKVLKLETAAAAIPPAPPVVAATIPPPTPPPPIPAVSVGTTRVYIPAGDSIQTAIDAASHGTMFTLGRGIHTVTTLDGSEKRALWFEGEGGLSYNEGGLDGCVIRCTTPNGIIYRDLGHGAMVKHSGPGFERITFHAAAANIIPLFTRMTNHITVKACSFQGTMTAAIDVDVPVKAHPNGDSAYHDFDRVNIVNTQPDSYGIHIGDGFVWMRALNIDLTGSKPCAIRNLRGVFNLMQSKFNHPGTHVYSSGASGTIIGNDFEQFPYTEAYCLIFERGANELHGAGCYHKVSGNNFTPHDDSGGPGAKTIYLGAGTYGNHVTENKFLYLAADSVKNLGNNVVRVD